MGELARATRGREVTRRVCRACGHAGRDLQPDRAWKHWRCPRCDADLYARPPRSYLEMEGFVEPAVAEVWGRPAGGGVLGALAALLRRVWVRTGQKARPDEPGSPQRADVPRPAEPPRARG